MFDDLADRLTKFVFIAATAKIHVIQEWNVIQYEYPTINTKSLQSTAATKLFCIAAAATAAEYMGCQQHQ